ncbi:Serpentine Receptor class X [Trichostrongylus colubriformis]|uniref:Serpentine Receptor class X n=1 Tax=Trichostrongylus colubriformis TaxID=6319 RepID=A0AAN8J1E4_TRICO
MVELSQAVDTLATSSILTNNCGKYGKRLNVLQSIRMHKCGIASNNEVRVAAFLLIEILSMSNSSSETHTALQNFVVSAVIGTVGIFGLLSNGAAMVAVRYNPVLRNSFGLLCFSHCSANFGVLLVFTLWVAPVTVIHGDVDMELIGKLFGLVNIMFWDVCVYSHLFISINRLIAITLPYQAATMLTLKNTSVVVAIAWFLGFCHIIAYFWTDTCFIYYDSASWLWIFADTVCGYVISTYTDCYTSISVLTAILLLDCTTLFMLRKNTKKLKAQSHDTKSSDFAIHRRRQTEVRFFWQTLYQNATFFYEISNFYYVCNLFENRWLVFFTSTFAWEICHALDGFIIVLFHFRWSQMRKVQVHGIQSTVNSRQLLRSQLAENGTTSPLGKEENWKP